MKTYEDFLVFLEEHLNHITDFIPNSDKHFRPVCFAVARFLLSEPYRWKSLFSQWPSLPTPPQPSQDQLLEFFNTQKGLNISFKKELTENNLDALYKAYNLLYPILITKHEFLNSIFRPDIRARRFKKIVKESEAKIKRVIEFITLMKHNDNFIQLMEKFTNDLSGFSLTVIDNKKLLDQVVEKLASIQ